MSVENHYVADFIPSASADLNRLAELDEEINQERQYWINSGAAEQLAVQLIEGFGGNVNEVPPP